MEKNLSNSVIKNLRYDLPASLVVFFVAVPLCLGISLASGAPLIAGLIAGALGGIVAGALSGSPLSVAGPAAGLTSIVVVSIQDLGSYQAFTVAVVLAGIIQVILGFIKAGSIGHFFPSSVIKGMLAGIGIILILKQIPHAFGNDTDYEGDESFLQADNQNTLTEIYLSIINFSSGAVIIAVCSLALLLFWGSSYIKKNKWLSILPGPIMAVLLGIVLNLAFVKFIPALALASEHLVDLPDFDAISSVFSLPDWGALSSRKVYIIALTLALVASLETLLSIEAADKMDPFKRLTPLNRELKAQGVTNTLSGLLGGLPVTSVIVRTSTNITSGAHTKTSTIAHGALIATSVLLFPHILEFIPLASLAAILLMVGFKLTTPELWKEMYSKGRNQFLPFAITATMIVFTNLLIGIFIGIAVSIFFVLRSNFRTALLRVNNGNSYLIKFTKDASFLNKVTLVHAIQSIPENSTVLFEGSNVQFFDHDIIEVITDFQKSAPTKDIQVEIKKTRHALHPFFKSDI
jgi:MFS superfamily sulfate permease-like transporter